MNNPTEPQRRTAIYNAALAQCSAGQFAAALATVDELLRHRPDGAVLNLAAVAYYQLGNFAAAEQCWRGAVAAKPSLAEAHNNLGMLLHARGSFAEAEVSLRTALRLQPKNPGALNTLGRVQADQGQAAAAEQSFRKAVKVDPRFVEAHLSLGTLLLNTGRPGEAETIFTTAATLAPRHPIAFFDLGKAREAQQKFDGAVAAYQQAVTLAPAFIDAYSSLAVVLRTLDRVTEAEAALRKALAVKADDAKAQWNLAILLMSQGRYDEGWPLFAARQRLDAGQGGYLPPALPFAEWRGEDLTGKSILVMREQGLGDEIQCARFVPWLKQRGARHVTVLTQAPLAPLFARVPGIDTLVPMTDRIDVMVHDLWTLPYNLARYLSPTLSDAAHLPYLMADPARIAQWSARLPQGRRRVGLVWRGGAAHRNNVHRSLRGLQQLRPLWSVPDVSFVSLQKGDDEAIVPPAEQPIAVLGPEIRDFADTAAIVDQLDLVIAVDTSVAHLAGALGKPCWVLVPRIDSDWRWIRGRSDTPWYPGVMRVFWQQGTDSWDATIAEVAEALRVWAS